MLHECFCAHRHVQESVYKNKNVCVYKYIHTYVLRHAVEAELCFETDDMVRGAGSLGGTARGSQAARGYEGGGDSVTPRAYLKSQYSIVTVTVTVTATVTVIVIVIVAVIPLVILIVIVVAIVIVSHSHSNSNRNSIEYRVESI